jgi:hypothetical protein
MVAPKQGQEMVSGYCCKLLSNSATDGLFIVTDLDVLRMKAVAHNEPKLMTTRMIYKRVAWMPTVGFSRSN